MIGRFSLDSDFKERAVDPKKPSAGEFAELDDEPGEIDPRKLHVPGAIASSIVAQIRILVEIYSQGAGKAGALRFLEWCPPAELERYIAMAVEYAGEVTHPGNQKATRRKKG